MCTDSDNDLFYSNVPFNSILFDPDDNNACIPDACGPTCDFDNDGLVNQIDPDDDNDGVLDVDAPTPCGPLVDNDGDGYYGSADPNSPYFDPNDDNGCVPDACGPTCDFDNDGLQNIIDTDDDSDGIPDADDPDPCGYNPCGIYADFDGDGIVNMDDPDDDNDGCPDDTDANDCDPTDQILTIHSSSLCPTEPGACEQVCEHSTVTYSVENPQGNKVYWDVEGAENFTTIGNDLLVNWGSAGSGEVKALIAPNKEGISMSCETYIGGPPDFFNFLSFNVSPTSYGTSFTVNVFGFSSTLNYGQFTDVVPNNYNGNITIYYEEFELGTCEAHPLDTNQPSINFTYIDSSPVDTSCNNAHLYGTIHSTYPIANFQIHNSNNDDYQFNITENQQNPNYHEYYFNIATLASGDFYTIIATDSTGLSQSFTYYPNCWLFPPLPCPKQGQTCVSILPRPKSIFTTEPAATNGVLNLCKGETVQFTNASEDASQTEWDFGDGTVSVLDEPLHKFSTPGVYEVKLIAGNGCACADTSKLTIHVSDAEIPEIQCVGPICQGDTATYHTNVSCGNYAWVISPNGSIIGGGSAADDFVTVRWNSGNSGSIQLTATNCTSNICDKPVREVVSILGGPVTIDGPGIVCPNSQASYSIPDFAGSDIVWSVSGNGNLISEGQNTNKISVKWGDNGGTVSVDYNNCFLECAGSGQKQVQVKSPSFIEGPIEVCVGENPFYRHKSLTTSSLVASNWQIVNASGAVVWSPNNTPGQVNPNWNFPPGQYIIRAVPTANSSGSCSAEAGLPVTVFGPPPTPSISGTAQICPTLIYTYTAQSSLANPEFHWTIKNGSSTTTKEGSSVTVKWGTSPPYALTLTQTDKNGPGCGSAPTTLEVQPLPALTISGQDFLCKGTNTTYTTQQFQDIDYQWSVEPATAGGILGGQGTPNVEVFWQTPGLHTLKLLACGSESSFPVEITTPITPEIVYPDSLCPGQTAMVSVIGNYTDWIWKNENGNAVSASPTPTLGPGHYSLAVADAAGCISSNTFFIAPLPLPDAKIKAQYLSFCSANPITLYALESQDGFSFQWLRNNQPIGTDEATFDASLPGSYRVRVTSQNGCTALSGPLLLTACDTTNGGGGGSGPPPPPNTGGSGCLPDGNIFFTSSPLSTCDSVQVQNLSQNMIANSQIWQVYDPLMASYYQSTTYEPAFNFNEVGFYLIRLWGRVPNLNDPTGPGCLQSHSEYIRIPLVAKFSAIESCAGLPTRFTDLSTFLPETSITAWTWDFGDPNSGIENTSSEQHPNHVYGQIGLYHVTLTVTSSTGCNVKIKKDVIVNGLPTVNFAPPAAICAASALNFSAISGNGAIYYTWDFGDPASGNGNFSQNQSTWHAYPQAGTYTVTVTVANIYGCTASHTANVSIEANDLSGEISPQDPAPICEGTSASFTAPSGGSAWSWSIPNGSASSSGITTSLAGVYAVTVTDSEGCVYKPEPVILGVIPAPIASIQAVELNEFGQPVAYHPLSYTACEGEDVYLEMVGDDKYIYAWSDGSTGELVNFTESNFNLLPVGQHAYTVTVTDIVTGCTAVVGPFPVTVNGAPATVAITSNPPGPLCDGTEATFTVVNPQPGLTYLWNSGDNGTSMAAAAAGSYLVQATNQFGCTAKSDPIEIHNAAAVGNAPAGCYTRCTPTDICLPQMPQIAEYQWFLNGTAILAPEGTVANFIPTESGDYTVQMTTIHGCVGISNPLSLSLEAPTGDLGGTVWLDVNENGVIDAGDTPLPGIGVLLAQNGVATDTLTSGTSGGFVFEEIPSENYQVQLDTTSLPSFLVPILGSAAAQLQGCHDSTGVQFLVKNLCAQPLSSTVQLTACQGDSAFYNGMNIPAGGSEQFVLQSFVGCDSTVTVSVAALPLSVSSLTLYGCPGDSVFYTSQFIPVGQTQAFVLQNQNGCDSTVTVTVAPFLTSASSLTLFGCPGDSVFYTSQFIPVGQTQAFVLQNQNGCDSTVTVNVAPFSTSASSLTLFGCPGDSVFYASQMVPVGQTQAFVLQNQNGCDSTVTVTVAPFSTSASSLTLYGCPGDSVFYTSQMVPVGQMQAFVFQNQNGCDSTVTVNVLPMSTSAVSLSLASCPGEPIIFDGQTLMPGDTMTFVYQNQFGCDSTVFVSVGLFPVASPTVMQLTVCPGDSVVFNGETLWSGDVRDYVFQDQNGCDSLVNVTVTAHSAIEFELLTEAICPETSEGSIELDLTAGDHPLTASLDGGSFVQMVAFDGLNGGNHSVQVQDAHGCLVSQSIEIQELAPLEVATEDYVLPCDEPFVTLRPTVLSHSGPLHWQWGDGSETDWLQAKQAGSFTIKISDDCSTEERAVSVTWGDNSPVEPFYVPNAFSPNGDGVNDEFRVYLAQGAHFDEFKLLVFDRWGNQLFETSDPEFGWNGIFRERLMDTGVVVWYVIAKVTVCGREMEVFKEGGVTIMR